MPAVLLGWIEHAEYVYGSYAVVLASVGAFTLRILRRSRDLASRVDDDDKYWH